MGQVAEKSDPKLWDRIKRDVTAGDKGGRAGQWSARKAQLATVTYKKKGGAYEGGKASDNHLRQWTGEEWRTRSGKESGETGERYLPKSAHAHLSKGEYECSTEKKRRDMRAGRQYSSQPKDIAKKTAHYRDGGAARPHKRYADLYAEAKARKLPGRSSMTRVELERALARKH